MSVFDLTLCKWRWVITQCVNECIWLDKVLMSACDWTMYLIKVNISFCKNVSNLWILLRRHKKRSLLIMDILINIFISIPIFVISGKWIHNVGKWKEIRKISAFKPQLSLLLIQYSRLPISSVFFYKRQLYEYYTKEATWLSNVN